MLCFYPLPQKHYVHEQESWVFKISNHERHRRTDGRTSDGRIDRQTDDMQSQYRARAVINRTTEEGVYPLIW